MLSLLIRSLKINNLGDLTMGGEKNSGKINAL